MDAPVRVEGYSIGGMVGRGTYGEVYKAWSKSPARKPVAIKSILKGKLSKVAVDNLLTEISLLKKLNHRDEIKLQHLGHTLIILTTASYIAEQEQKSKNSLGVHPACTPRIRKRLMRNRDI